MRFLILIAGGVLLVTSLVMGIARRADPQSPYITFVHENNLFKVRPDGSRLQRLTTGYYEEGSHAWSPDGKWIAFASYRDGGLEIYKMRPNGKTIQRLTDGEGSRSTPNWSPDSQDLIFDGRHLRNWQLYQLPADASTPPTQITQASDGATFPAVSPDGKWIAFITNPGNDEPLLYLRSWDGSSYRQVNAPTSSAYLPAWSPDSQTLLISVNIRSVYSTLYQLKITDSAIEGVPFPTSLPSDTSLIFPSWSPDGNWIAFIGMRSGTAYLYKMRVDGSDLQRVTDIDRNIWFPRWSPIIDLRWQVVYNIAIGLSLVLSSLTWSKFRAI